MKNSVKTKIEKLICDLKNEYVAAELNRLRHGRIDCQKYEGKSEAYSFCIEKLKIFLNEI